MGRPKNPVPTYRRHTPSNTARCWVGGKWVTLGPWNSPESKAAFERVCAESRGAIDRTCPAAVPSKPLVPAAGLTVVELILAFWRHARAHYRDTDGAPTTELEAFKSSLAPLRELYGDTPAADFGPLKLKAVRDSMVSAGLSRKVVNQRVGRVKRAFKWAVAEELVPPAAFQALAAVAGLQKGRTPARETDPVGPVPDAAVAAACAVLPPVLAAMVALQRLAGMRPAELCRLTPGEIDRTTAVWTYRPAKHKGNWRGKPRVICFGPKAQALLAGVVKWDEPDAAVFRPADAKEQRYAAKRAARKSKVPPSQRDRRVPASMRVRHTPARYSAVTYWCAIEAACATAGVPHWHPNQLRHSYATEVRRLYGLEAAGAGLGHAKMSATEVYAERDAALAAKVAAEIG